MKIKCAFCGRRIEGKVNTEEIVYKVCVPCLIKESPIYATQVLVNKETEKVEDLWIDIGGEA